MENLGTVIKKGKIPKSYRILETSPDSNLMCLLIEPPPSRIKDKVKLWLKTNFLSSTIDISFLFKALFKVKVWGRGKTRYQSVSHIAGIHIFNNKIPWSTTET